MGSKALEVGGKRGTTLESGWGGRVHRAEEGLDVGDQGGGAIGMLARCLAGQLERVMLITQTGNLKVEGGL